MTVSRDEVKVLLWGRKSNKKKNISLKDKSD